MIKVQNYGFMVLFTAAAAWLLIIPCNNAHHVAAEATTARHHHQHGNLRYEKVSFNITYDTTADEYDEFIKDIIKHLECESPSNGIPRLCKSSTQESDSKRFLLVGLTNSEEQTVILAIDAVNLYLVGYQAGNNSYFFSNATGVAYLFEGTNRHNLSYGGSYVELERQAGVDSRDQIELGREPLIRAVSELSYASSSKTQARSFIVVIQMICEAARFRDISWRVRESIETWVSFYPDTYMLSLETSWGQQCTRVQQSVGGAFTTSLTLQLGSGKTKTLSNVRDVVANLAIMLFVCGDRSSTVSSHNDELINHQKFPPLLIRSVVEDDDTCPISEPTVRISGRDGHCIDVRNYTNGYPVQLWPCETNDDPNQLWTLKSNGTVQSNGSCLTASGYVSGNDIMINDCNTAATAATRWEIWDNGTIINPQSGLVVSAKSGNNGTTLTVETNVYASAQGWLATNDTEPREVFIVGYGFLCMQNNGTSSVWLEDCDSDKQDQIWALYSDGSIRPKQNQDRCLTCASDSSSAHVTTESCSIASSGQRWVFTNEGNILNLHNGLVMDVDSSESSLGDIIIYPVTGKPTQEWLPLPILDY